MKWNNQKEKTAFLPVSTGFNNCQMDLSKKASAASTKSYREFNHVLVHCVLTRT